MSRVVQAGTLKSVSASQINTFLDCRRKWYFDKVMGCPQPETEAMGRGTRIHEQMEKWYQFGTEPTYPSAIAALQLGTVPQRDPNIIIEEPRNYGLGLFASGVPVRGRIDMFLPPENGIFKVLDWKSTSNLRYAKSPEELARNPQGIIYLKYGFQQHPDAHYGIFQHVYLKTKNGFGAVSVETDLLDRAHVDRVYAHIESVVAEMKETAAIPTVADVPPELSACDKYGGCPYRGTCPRVARSILSELEEESPAGSILTPLDEGEPNDMSNIADKLKARKASTASINPPDAAKPASTTVTSGRISAAEANPSNYPRPLPDPSVVGLDQWSRDKVAEAQAPVVSPSGSGSGHPAASENTAVCLYLYIDCQPTYGVSVDVRLEEEIAKRTPDVLGYLTRNDPKNVPGGAVDVREVKFGAGVATLCSTFKRDPPRGVVVASSQGLSGLVVETLLPMASLVVKAVR